jgi:hypothetical protein
LPGVTRSDGEMQRLVLPSDGPLSIVQLRGWSRFLGVPLMLVTSIFLSNPPLASAIEAVDASESTFSRLEWSEAPDVALPTGVGPLRTLIHGRLSLIPGVVLTGSCLASMQTLPDELTTRPLKPVPGRRGRALLQAYLN